MYNAAIKNLQLCETDEGKFISYFSQVNQRGKTYHVLPWHSLAMLNCNEDGSLINLNDL